MPLFAFMQIDKIEVISSFSIVYDIHIACSCGFSYIFIGCIPFYFVWQAVKRDQHTLPKAKDESQCPPQSGEYVKFGTAHVCRCDLCVSHVCMYFL